MPSSLQRLMKFWTSRGLNSSVSIPFAFITRFDHAELIAHIQNGKRRRKPASWWCRRSKRLHKPWKVPTHIARGLIGIMFCRRASISLAALLVKVTARISLGWAYSVEAGRQCGLLRRAFSPNRRCKNQCGLGFGSHCLGLLLIKRFSNGLHSFLLIQRSEKSSKRICTLQAQWRTLTT